MSIGSISFWQQNQNYWARATQDSQTQAQTNAVISSMFGASTTLSAGLASIANQTALSRVNSQLTSAVQSALDSINGGSSSTSSSQGSTGSSSSSSSGSSSGSSSSSSSAASAPTPATGTGTVPLNAGTSLLTLGTVSDGTNTTTYQSTRNDTVGDLLNAINQNAYGKAQVAAWLDPSGKLVITAKNQTATIQVGGAYAANVGFGTSNNFFQPTVPTPASSTSSASSSDSSSSSASASSNSSTSGSTTASTTSAQAASTTLLRNSALALQSSGTAEILLASSGLSGSSIVNLLA